MTFQELHDHVEGYGCTIDPYDVDAYWVSNCINGESCLIERLHEYAVPTLCHYFMELGIPPPDHIRSDYESYRKFREGIPDDVPEDIESDDE